MAKIFEAWWKKFVRALIGLAICVPYKAGSETWRYLLSSLANTSHQQPLTDLEQLQLYRRAIQVHSAVVSVIRIQNM